MQIPSTTHTHTHTVRCTQDTSCSNDAFVNITGKPCFFYLASQETVIELILDWFGLAILQKLANHITNKSFNPHGARKTLGSGHFNPLLGFCNWVVGTYGEEKSHVLRSPLTSSFLLFICSNIHYHIGSET